MKKTNNKGFSLVELIIVIAIMAILAGAIAPALIKYIDKSRKSNDVSSAKTIKTAIETALGTESVYEVLTNNSFTGGTGYTTIVFNAGSTTPTTDPGTAATTARTADTAYTSAGTNMTVTGCKLPTGSTIAEASVEYSIASNIGEKMPKTKYQKNIDINGKKDGSNAFKPETFFAIISNAGTVYVGVCKKATAPTFNASSQTVTANGAILAPTVCDGYQ